MEIVDSQIHTFDVDNERYPWHRGPEFKPMAHSTTPFTYDDVLAGMAEAGVDSAVLVIPGTYGDENGYLLEAYARHPDRFAIVGKLPTEAPDLDERIRTFRDQPGMLGLRIVVRNEAGRERWERGDWAETFASAERHDVPVCVNAPEMIAEIGTLAERHPGLTLLVDHLGLAGPPMTPLGDEPFAGLDTVLALARHPNVSIKASGVTALSREQAPFRDVWRPLLDVIGAFGVDRVMWGSDLTRVRQDYGEVTRYIGQIPDLSADELAKIYGANVRRILRWPAQGAR